MGYDNYKIHSDGVIEREDDKLEAMLLNIIEVGSHKMNPLGAFLAQRKCFKIAKNERKLDYKEYVERLQLDHYPIEFKRSELGRRLCIIFPFAILFSASSIVFLILSITTCFDECALYFIAIASFILAFFMIRLINKQNNKIKELKNE